MPKINTQLLREFVKNTSSIRPGKMIPGESYYLFEKDRVTKTNTITFCSFSLKFDTDKPFLVEQQKLHSVLSATKDEYITVTDGKSIEINDTKYKTSHPVMSVENFPGVPNAPEEDGCDIDQFDIDALSIAKSFVSPNENLPHLQVIHMNENYIAATDCYIMYYEKFDKHFPNILFSKDDVSIIQQYTMGRIFDTEKRYFFSAGDYLYSFAKTEAKTPDFNTVVSKLSDSSGGFTIDKKELITFCEIANSYTGSAIPSCVLSNEKISLISSKNEKVEMPVTLGNDFEFAFNSRYLLPALKAIPVSELKCSIPNTQHKAIVIKEDNFICSLMGFVPQNV